MPSCTERQPLIVPAISDGNIQAGSSPLFSYARVNYDTQLLPQTEYVANCFLPRLAPVANGGSFLKNASAVAVLDSSMRFGP